MLFIISILLIINKLFLDSLKYYVNVFSILPELSGTRIEGDLLQEFLKDDAGATAIEYGPIAALVSVAALAALINLGDSVRGDVPVDVEKLR